MQKKWFLKPKAPQAFQEKFPEIGPVILQLLYNRGLDSQEKVDEFLNPDYGQDIHDPFLFNEMERVVERILKAVKNKEKVVVHGDYDADGVCGTVILATLLKELGLEPEIYIPHRETEGYGLSESTVLELAKQKVNLIITVDCGITNKQEIDLANQKGIEVIVTDHHHEPPFKIEAEAVLNPRLEREKYPFKELSGAGVVFKLVQAMVASKKTRLNEAFSKWLLDLAAIATVTDSCPLLGENRTIVKYGLIVLRKTKRVGLSELYKIAKLNPVSINTYNIGFQVGPRLNAAGRLAHASVAYQLLITANSGEAKNIAEKLNDANQRRQRLTEQLILEAKKQLKDQLDQKILFAIGDNWPAGVVGLVAGKLSDEYSRPVMVMGRSDEEIVGSGRSIPSFNIIEALDQVADCLSRYGGHAQACGFTMMNEKNLLKFKEELIKIASRELKGPLLQPVLEVEAELKLEEVNWNLWEELEKFEPFGEANERPKFLAEKLQVTGLEKVGQTGKHLRIFVSQDSGTARRMIGFSLADKVEGLKIGDLIDAVFEVDVNEWNGTRELQLRVVDLKISSS